MRAVRFASISLCVVVTSLCYAQDSTDLARLLSFEMQHAAGALERWGGGPLGTIFADDKVVHSGHWSARLERNDGSPETFSTITSFIPSDFAGKNVEFRGFLRAENVSDFIGLWMREDGESGSVAFENMQKRQVKGTFDWTEYSITLPLRPEAKRLFFGFLLSGTGKAWADDLQLLVDGKPVWEAPKAERPKTVLDRDHEFDGGSGITLHDLSKIQIENLSTLGKVWGLLKYHHPRVTSGELHWDYELLRVLPAILAAPDRAAGNAAMQHWITGMGAVRECAPCATLEEKELYLRPDLAFLSDNARLGTELSSALQSIHRNRTTGKQFYVSLTPGVGNPSFEHELGYKRIQDAGFQIIGLYRLWNIIEYWFPYRDVLGEKWDDVLAEFIPRIALAKTSEDYQLQLMGLFTRIHDTHANLWSSLVLRPPVGDCQLPVDLRFIGDRAVVTATKESGIKPGDVIETLDGVTVQTMVERWKPWYAASNEPTRLRDIARSMTRGACGEALMRVRRDAETLEIKIARVPPEGPTVPRPHDSPGETFHLLPDKIAYLKLSSVKAAEAAHYIDAAAGTKGLIIDIRNYPSEFMVFALGSLLVEKPTEFVRFANGDLSNPGAFHWTKTLSLQPAKPHYAGKVVILVDESSQSQAEYTAMAFRAAPKAIVVGSTTAGADGNVSQIPLPGIVSGMISGIGIFYPDKKPTQRVGIVPDVEVKPTIEGIRAGRDEVLEEAVRQINF